MASLKEIEEGEKATRARIKLIAYTHEYILDEELNIIDQKDESSSHGTQMEEVENGNITIDGITYEKSYEIWNKAQLENFRDRVNAGETFENSIITQKANINLNNEKWEPIATGDPFNGRYNGENHNIIGININSIDPNQGLFMTVMGESEEKYAVIENLNVQGEIIGAYNVGGIVGWMQYAVVKNCTNKANVTATDKQVDAYWGDISSAGGIIGMIGIKGGNVIDCKNYGTITASYTTVGGIIGWHRKGNITGCENHAELINSNASDVGGIVGWLEEGSIEKCYNTKKIQSNGNAGGIFADVGYNYNGTIKSVSISKVKNIAEIVAPCTVGGIGGAMNQKCSIELASNYGYVHSTEGASDNLSYTGGILGFTYGNSSISYCYNIGNVEAPTRGVGGIVGLFASTNVNINNCYNIGDISNTNIGSYSDMVGGIWGYSGKLKVTATNCWQLQDCIKQGTDTDQKNVENKTEDEIKALNWENYVVVEGKNEEYPILIWENE